MEDTTFSVLQWNILGDIHCKKEWFPNVHDESFLLWENRMKRIIEIVEERDPTIFCFEENDHHQDFLLHFSSKGYDGAYVERPGWSHEGCSIFWNRERFSLIEKESVQFNDIEIRENNVVFYELVNKPSNKVGNIVRLKDLKEERREVIVASLHLFWNDELSQIQYAQINYLVERIEKMLMRWNKTRLTNMSCEPAVIICGDFNQEPFEDMYPSTSVYKYMTNWSYFKDPNYNGHHHYHHETLENSYLNHHDHNNNHHHHHHHHHHSTKSHKMNDIWGMCSSPAAEGWSHRLGRMRSAYDNYEMTGREPEYTSIGNSQRSTLDYIFYSSSLLNVVEVHSIPYIPDNLWLPSFQWPSDHLPLCSKFRYKV